MDLSNLSACGRSTTSIAWATNPIRSLLWRLISPYFRGASVEISTEMHESILRLQRHLENSLGGDLTAVKSELSSQIHLFMSRMDERIVAEHTLSSQTHDLKSESRAQNKDRLALASRLAGLEEQAINANSTVRTLDQRLGSEVDSWRATVESIQAELDQLKVSKFTSHRDGQLVVGKGGLVIAETQLGLKLLVRPHDHVGAVILGGKDWEPHVRDRIMEFAHPASIAVDAGAYIGVHTLTMARWFKVVHAFEPQRLIFQTLCANVALNDCNNVFTYNLALYDGAGEMRLSPEEWQDTAMPMKDGQLDYARVANAAALSFDFVTDGQSGETKAIALDDLHLENVGFIKVDAQGSDFHVLRGSLETIRRCRPVVTFEWERDLAQRHGASLEELQSFFVDLSFEVEILREVTPERQIDFIAIPK